MVSLNPWGQISQTSPLELIEHFLQQTLEAAALFCVYIRMVKQGVFSVVRKGHGGLFLYVLLCFWQRNSAGFEVRRKKASESCKASNLVVQQTQCLQDTWHAHGDTFTSLDSKILYACEVCNRKLQSHINLRQKL